MGTKKGRVRARAVPVPAKQPKTTAAVSVSTQGETPLFSFAYVNRPIGRDWGFSPSDQHATAILGFICEMARLSWAEIERQQTGGKQRHRKHHSQAVHTFSKEAQDDLGKTRLGETFGDEMFRFRVGGEQRLWGFRDGRVFHVVWWDPDHEVYPQDN